MQEFGGDPIHTTPEQDEDVRRLQATGFTTVLLVENDDIALMNDSKMFDAIRWAFPDGPPPGVDQVWYADTSISGALELREFTPELRKSTV